MGGSSSKSESNSSANMNQDVWGGQGDALQNLYGNAENLFGQNGQYSDQLNNIAQSLGPAFQNIFGGAQQGMQDQLGGGAYGDSAEIRQQLMDSMGGRSNMGSMYESIVGGPGNTYIDPMVDAMRQSGNQQLQTMESGTGLDAAALGQGGSSRHAMQNAMQNAQGAQDMNQQEMNMRGGAYDTDLAMKMGIAQQADSNRQADQNRMMDMLSGSNASQQYGMGAGQGVQNLGMGQMAPWMQAQNQGWGAMNNYANTIGAPTVLSSGSQNANSKASAGGGGGPGYKGGQN